MGNVDNFLVNVTVLNAVFFQVPSTKASVGVVPT